MESTGLQHIIFYHDMHDQVDDELSTYVSMTKINSCISQTSPSSQFIFSGRKDVGILHIYCKYLLGGRGGLGEWGHGQILYLSDHPPLVALTQANNLYQDHCLKYNVQRLDPHFGPNLLNNLRAFKRHSIMSGHSVRGCCLIRATVTPNRSLFGKPPGTSLTSTPILSRPTNQNMNIVTIQCILHIFQNTCSYELICDFRLHVANMQLDFRLRIHKHCFQITSTKSGLD